MNAKAAKPAENTCASRASRALRSTVFVLLVACTGSSVSAQIAPPPGSPAGQPLQPLQPPTPAPATPPKSVTETTVSDRREGFNDQKDWHFIGHVEMDQGGDTKIYAEDVWAYSGKNQAVATGNVVFAQGNNRISAERAEFNTETRLGTFYNAWGMTTVKPQAQAPRPGQISAPTMTGQENVVYFFGETIEKIGPKKYKITNGGFSTCVQPTPRWDLHAGTVILNVDHYTLLTNAVLAVKGVPMMYLPVLYYPTKREDRATGFLIPTYGTTSLRGQSIHNAFFWAINRSQDATIMHDWFSKTGQGVGTEYRYNMGAGNDGTFRAYMDDKHAATYILSSGQTAESPAERSYDIRGNLNQMLPGNLRARANVNYFSSIVSSQTFNMNIQDASRNDRSYGGNIVGAWRNYTLNATLEHSEYFYDTTTSAISGTWPRVTLMRNERPIGNSQAYFSVSGEYARLLRDSKGTDTELDASLSRLDVSPQIRYPFKKWQWFTVNSTVSWRDTYYTRSYALADDGTPTNSAVDVGLNRPVFIFQSQIVGPVFNRVWDTPENGYAEKFKHTIEPVLTIDRTSSVDNFQRIIVFDGIDNYVGGTRYTYGLNNRFYAKRQTTPGQPAQSREIADVEVSQSYYTDQRQSLYDRQYQTQTLLGTTPETASHFSAIALNIRAMPTNEFNATVRAEFDSRYHALRTISAQGSYSWSQLVQTNLGWSKNGYIPELAGFNDRALLDHYINGSTNVHTRDNRYGAQYTFNYNVLHGALTQQQITGFYNAQCCGIAFQYQTYNYGAFSISPIPADHRFFLSFTLAGLGNFSPFNGAMSGVPR
jgi:LPS-assembly protein